MQKESVLSVSHTVVMALRRELMPGEYTVGNGALDLLCTSDLR